MLSIWVVFSDMELSGGAGGIAARGQIYIGALIGVVEIH